MEETPSPKHTKTRAVLAIADHFQWFHHFLTVPRPLPFSQLLSFFFFVVWWIPAIYFISVSANDAVLPRDTSPTSIAAARSRNGAGGGGGGLIRTWGTSLGGWKETLLGPGSTRKGF